MCPHEWSWTCWFFSVAVILVFDRVLARPVIYSDVLKSSFLHFSILLDLFFESQKSGSIRKNNGYSFCFQFHHWIANTDVIRYADLLMVCEFCLSADTSLGRALTQTGLVRIFFFISFTSSLILIRSMNFIWSLFCSKVWPRSVGVYDEKTNWGAF